MTGGRVLRRWLPPLIWMAAIFAASSLPGATVKQAPFQIVPQLAHAGEYCVLGLLLYRALWLSGVRGRLRLYPIALLASIAYAATDEFHQSFVPGRDPSWGDMAFDALGALLAHPLAELLLRFRRRRR